MRYRHAVADGSELAPQVAQDEEKYRLCSCEPAGIIVELAKKLPKITIIIY
jgi:hypothetical protein